MFSHKWSIRQLIKYIACRREGTHQQFLLVQFRPIMSTMYTLGFPKAKIHLHQQQKLSGSSEIDADTFWHDASSQPWLNFPSPCHSSSILKSPPAAVPSYKCLTCHGWEMVSALLSRHTILPWDDLHINTTLLCWCTGKTASSPISQLFSSNFFTRDTSKHSWDQQLCQMPLPLKAKESI